MSWLYTVVFTGLLFSSPELPAPTSEYCFQNEPVSAERRMMDETEKFEKTYPLNANGRVNISNINGSITITAWDRNEVKLEYTKIADARDRLADVEVKIDSKPEYLKIETDYGNWNGKYGNDRWRNNGKLDVDFKLMVPRGAVLNEIETVNGSVLVSNFVNITRVSAVNGTVNATNIRGTAKLSTVNGEVTADFDRLASGSNISLDTVNGRVRLTIPSDSNATVKADSLNGSISNDFGLPVRKGKYIGRDLFGRLGNGEVQIKLSSVNGGLAILRKGDGRNQSPAVNLLPQKDKGGDDWDTDITVSSSARIDKEVAKATKESLKIQTKTMADAHKEMSKLQPELAKIVSDSVAAASVAAGTLAQAAQLIKLEDMQQGIKTAQEAQQVASARFSDAAFFPLLPRVETVSDSFPVKGTPKVTLNATGASIAVRGWDKSEVQYRITQYADARFKTPLNIKENHTDSAVNLTIENTEPRNGRFFNGSNRVRVEIFVPKKSNLKITSDNEIRLDGVSGEIELHGADESINVRDVDGTLKIKNVDGRVRVIGFSGDLDAVSADGIINLEGDFKSLKARSADGAITLTLPENLSADIEANCEQIKGEGIRLSKLSTNESFTKYRLGNGGPLFQITTQGEIHVRGIGTLRDLP